MGISFLRPFLQSLCCNSPWNYAVFWKLKHQDELVLVWEDGFCDNMKPRSPVLSQIEDLYLESSNKIWASTFSSTVSAFDETPGEYPVGLAVAEMSSASHVVGKGVVGNVAFTGNARWIYSNNIAADIFNSVLVPEYPDEWLLQFAAGIRTILLLPVIPHGVLQLGSTELVPENVALVAYVKDKFEAQKETNGYDWGYAIQEFSLMSTFMNSLDEPSTIATEKVIEDQNAVHTVTTEDCTLTANQMNMPMFMVQDYCNRSVRFDADTVENATESEFSQQQLDMSHVAEELSSEDYKPIVTESDISRLNHEEKLKASPYCDNFDRMSYGNFMNELMDFQFEESTTEPTFVGNDFDSYISKSGCNFFSFSEDYELQKALGTDVENNSYQYTYGASISGQNAACSTIGDREPSYVTDMSGLESVVFPINELEVDHALEAIVANAVSSFNDNSSKSNVTSLSMSSEKHASSSKRHDRSKHSASVEEEEEVPWNFLSSEFIAQGMNTLSSLSGSVSSVESKISSLCDKQQRRQGSDSPNPGNLSRLSTTNNKKRARNADNQKPRPRDRQLIQDRIKELRELVPNTEKCSIDGLLDKTIKHMLFLRSVTNQADKLRHQVLEQETDEKTRKTDEVNNKHQNGTSWAVEIGSEQKLCPIVVKDLDHPGHMLIEMLCTDHGRFLEIADVIHRLQLTILKGIMKKTTDNSWARFIVETSGSFHRLDIFWPLMQLLQ